MGKKKMMNNEENKKILCWYCGLPFHPHKYDIIPTQARCEVDAEGNKNWSFFGVGFFHHNAQCLSGYMNNYFEKNKCPMHLEKQYRENLSVYYRVVHGLPFSPPPHLPKVMLKEYGGHLTWEEWRARSWQEKIIDSWEIDHYIREQRNKAVRYQEYSVHQMPPPSSTSSSYNDNHPYNTIVNIPGITDILDAFIEL